MRDQVGIGDNRGARIMTEAVRHQLAMDGLAEIVACHEEEHGALTEAARRELFGDVNAEGVERGAA
ncbi:hypothetical protein ACFV2A_28420 [Streptomyces californicus]|uniref:hypothetical protein n=1 Tax=Streptomyces TaxID=1883 RepID=UPI0006AFAAD4